MISGPLNTMEEMVNDAYFQERVAFAEIDHSEAGRLTYPGRPFIMSKSPWSIRRPAPLLGQHTEEVLVELGYTKADIARLREQNVV